MENIVNLSADEIRIADNYNREYPGLSRDQAIAKAKQVLTDIAARGKEVPPAIVTKPVNHHLGVPIALHRFPTRRTCIATASSRHLTMRWTTSSWEDLRNDAGCNSHPVSPGSRRRL